MVPYYIKPNFIPPSNNFAIPNISYRLIYDFPDYAVLGGEPLMPLFEPLLFLLCELTFLGSIVPRSGQILFD
jgi:hypothetical protein